MGKTADDTLHHLVHSLNKTEIRDFRASAGRGLEKQPAYAGLFDLLLQQETFDDDALFRDSGYTRKATYNETKRYLHETLLQELCAWKNKRSREFRARNLYDQARVLAERHLQQQALDKLQQALAFADRYEQHELAFSIIAFREELLRGMNAIGALLPESEPNHKRKQQHLTALRQRADLQLTYSQLFCYYREYSSRSAKQLVAVANRLGKRKNDVPRQYEEQRLYYSVLEKKAEILRQSARAIAIQQKMIALIEQNLHHENAHTDYAIWLHNLHASYVHTDNPEAAAAVIRKMQQAAPAPARLRTHIRLIRYNAEIFFRLKQHQYAAIKKLHDAYVTDLPLTLVKNNPNAQVWLLHQFTFATAFFMTGDYKNCIRLLFVMDNQNQWEIGQKIILESFALKALAHRERDQPDQAGNMVKRYFALVQESGKPATVSPTQLLLKTLQKHLKTGEPMRWKQLLQEIDTFCEGKIPADFVLYDWVRKKVGLG